MKDETGKWIKENIIGKRFWVTLIITLAVAALFYFGINELISAYKEIALNPCKYCIDCITKPELIKAPIKFP